MGVEGSATDQEIIKAVADAGYGASAKEEKKTVEQTALQLLKRPLQTMKLLF